MKLIAFAALAALQVGSLDKPPVKARQYVAYIPEQRTIRADKRTALQLRFQVQPGFHINSHTPAAENLIPTHVEFQARPGVKLGAAEYSPGRPFSLSFDPGEKLDVYAEDFTVALPVTASSGTKNLSGTLNYQACDRAMCYPPRTLPISVEFTAK